jgi:hypothetical protein
MIVSVTGFDGFLRPEPNTFVPMQDALYSGRAGVFENGDRRMHSSTQYSALVLSTHYSVLITDC